jgi:predicted O-methyltransferase YrrM
MNEQLWTSVDQYISNMLVAEDPGLSAALADSAAAGLPEIHVAPNQGKLLNLLAGNCGARRILEIGTLGGYSTIWLARALSPGGKLITIEALEKHATVARKNVERAGLTNIIELHLGRALDILRNFAKDQPSFDFFFIDADKQNNADYFAYAIKLSHPGSVIVIDNVIRTGKVIDAASTDPAIIGTRRLYEAIKNEPRVSATALQTVGSKGYDGFILATVH